MAEMKMVGSRLVVERNFAVFPPDSWVASNLPGWRATEAIILASPALGADFTQYVLQIASGGGSQHKLPPGIQGFLYVLDGEIAITVEGGARTFQGGGYAYFKPGSTFSVEARGAARATFIKKKYEPLEGHPPRSLSGQEQDVKGENFLGIEGLVLQHLVPDELGFDMAVNIFTFQTGKALPMIESHIMEHGLIFLQGGGMYYLGNRWMEVRQGDFIWMGPYCPQSFYAAGEEPSRYLYYKNVNRDVSL